MTDKEMSAPAEPPQPKKLSDFPPERQTTLVAEEGYRNGMDMARNMKEQTEVARATMTQRLIAMLHVYAIDVRHLVDDLFDQPDLLNTYTAMWVRGFYDGIRGSGSQITPDEWGRAAESIIKFAVLVETVSEPKSLLLPPLPRKTKWDISEVE